MKQDTLSKSERLCGLKAVDWLFKGDQSRAFTVFPLRAVYASEPAEEGVEPLRIMVSVPKRFFKRAVKRNRVKRQVREAFRHHKHQLADDLRERGLQMSLAFIWIDDHLYDSDQVGRRVVTILKRIKERL